MNVRWWLFLAPACANAFGLSLTAPLFDRLQFSELEDHESKVCNDSAGPRCEFEVAQVRFFLAESSSLLSKPHASQHWANLVAETCHNFESQDFTQLDTSIRSVAAYTCAMARAKEIGGKFAFLQLGVAKTIQKDLDIAKANGPAMGDKLYAEGRVFMALPPGWGQDLGKSLLSFLMLQRLSPQNTSATFFLARAYQMKGNLERAAELYRQALDSGDFRTQFFFSEKEGFIRLKEINDEATFGILPGLFYNPARGFGGQVAVIDEKFLDTDRAVGAKVSVATRQIVELGIKYTDDVSASFFGLELLGNMYYGTEDFYGVGINSSSSTPINVWRTTLQLDAKIPFGKGFYVALGFRGRAFDLNSTPDPSYSSQNFIDAINSVDVGPLIELSYDTRDSDYTPSRGQLISSRFYFASPWLGSYRSFQEFTFAARSYVEFANALVLSLNALGTLQWGEVPFAAFVRSGRSFVIPGVREGRYQEQDCLGAFGELRVGVTGSLSAVFFGSILTFSETAGVILSSPYGAGGGTGFEVFPSDNKRDRARLELGYFNSEWLVQMSGGLGF
jgi:hypothetical protein